MVGAGPVGIGRVPIDPTDRYLSWDNEAATHDPETGRRWIADSGTVELDPLLSQRTVAVPALGSTAWTLPSSPVAFLRT